MRSSTSSQDMPAVTLPPAPEETVALQAYERALKGKSISFLALCEVDPEFKAHLLRLINARRET